jgi:hypothetical protein
LKDQDSLNGNRFTSIPKIDKEVWDNVQSMHPKTLAASILCNTGKSDAVAIAYAELMEEIYDMANSDDMPLHRGIGVWRAVHNGEDLAIDILDCKYLFVQCQKLLNKIEPGSHRLLDDARAEVERYTEKFLTLSVEDEVSHKEMTLRELLAAVEAFHVVNYR